MSTYGSGMWDNFKENDQVGHLVRDAVSETEAELFNDALDLNEGDDGYFKPVPNFDNSVEEMEDISGETHSNDEWFTREPDGRPTADSDGGQYEPQHRQQHHDEPPAEIFADPDGWRRQTLQDRVEHMTGGGSIPQVVLNMMPARDENMLFENPERFRHELAQDAASMSHLVKQYRDAESALTDELHNAADDVGQELWDNVKAHMYGNVPPQHRHQFEEALVMARAGGQDVVRLLVNQYRQAEALQEHANRHGYKLPTGVGISKPQVNWAARSKGLTYEKPTSREAAEEEDIFQAAFQGWRD